MELKELLKINSRYLFSHYEITENDLKMVNNLIKIIENTRDTKTPKTGDTIKLTTEFGDYYGNAIITGVWDNGDIEICECPYIPFYGGYDELKNKIFLSVSGGSFHTINRKLFKYKGKTERLFCDWGSCGACADGAINFYAPVNIWEVKLKNKYHPYTTEKYNKMHIHKNVKNHEPYTILGDMIAFETEEDYQAFLKTFRAKEFKGFFPNHTIIFYYKEEEHYISKDDWNKLKGYQIDTRRINGSIVTVKVKYDNKNKKIIVYRYANSFEPEEQISNKPYILNR